MTKPLIAISAIAMTAALSAVPTGAQAEAVDLYFSAAPYICNGPEFAAEWRLIGDSTGTLSIQAFERRSDLNGARFSGVEWQVNAADLAAPLNLTNRNNQPQLRISGLLEGEPSIVPVTSNGEPKANCSPVFEITRSAEERYQDVFSLLDTAAPSPDDAKRVVSEVAGLPPVNLLPDLQQAAANSDTQRKTADFWTRYAETSQTRAADISDADILPGLDAMLVSAVGNQKRWHSELLVNANAARVAALIDAEQDPVSNAVTAEQFCMRLDNFVNNSQWRVNLGTLTGVPVDHWDEAFAQSYLQTAATCEKSDFFTQTVTRRWPEVLKSQEGRSALISHAERIASMEITLENAASENWLDLSRSTVAQYRDAGVEAADVTAILGTVLDARRAESVPLLGAELANGGLDLSLAEMPTFCARERRALSVTRYEQATVLPAVEAACNTVVTAAYLEKAIAIIERRKTELLEQEETLEALVGNDYFSVAGALVDVGRASGEFDTANQQILAAVDEADAALNDKRQAVLDAVTSDVTAVLQISDPSEAQSALNQLCAPISNSFDNRMKPLRDACQSNAAVLTVRRDRELCNQTWETFDAPDGFRQGTIRIPGASTPMSIETMVCSPEFRNLGLEVVDNSGLFRTQYLLSREEAFGGTPVKFTAVLDEPNSGSNEWTLSNPEINGASLTSPDYKTSVDFMGCAIRLEQCFRQN